jgi:hypothetical protein
MPVDTRRTLAKSSVDPLAKSIIAGTASKSCLDPPTAIPSVPSTSVIRDPTKRRKGEVSPPVPPPPSTHLTTTTGPSRSHSTLHGNKRRKHFDSDRESPSPSSGPIPQHGGPWKLRRSTPSIVSSVTTRVHSLAHAGPVPPGMVSDADSSGTIQHRVKEDALIELAGLDQSLAGMSTG